ncbi:MAG: histidinol dehydrogenase [Chitinophagaceae bacterium]|nr:histidinol dehydrogenase [Chitinophagaceae bacterium]
MIRILHYNKLPKKADMFRRPVSDLSKIKKIVQQILNDVKKEGDKALMKYAKKFEGAAPDRLVVSPYEIRLSSNHLSPALKKAIKEAYANIYTYHAHQKNKTEIIQTQPGIRCWQAVTPVEKVGLYIPGGTAPLFSTVLMLGIPAKIAGCKEIILCSPGNHAGDIHPAILYSASLCGIKKIFRVGGAQAIAAMAYGTTSVPAVYKIFGPGNPYVTAAKMLVQQEGVAIDMPAGPSEILIIADDSAPPDYIAADLLAQAEHGPDSQVLLITPDFTWARKVAEEVKRQLEDLPRKKIAAEALKNSCILIVRDMMQALDLSNRYAPEHLMLCCRNYSRLIKKIANAGSVFLGKYSPESAGDYASGTNHTLPTGGYARAFSGVSLDSFQKKINFQQLSRKGLLQIANTVMTMAETEQLEAHKRSVSIRLK